KRGDVGDDLNGGVVIEFGDSYKAPTNPDSAESRTGRTITPTTEDMQKKKNDVKARTTLLLSLPDEHQLWFSKYKTAKELWAASLKTFSGNEATKKRKKNILKQQYGNFKAEGTETLEQTFNRLQCSFPTSSDVFPLPKEVPTARAILPLPVKKCSHCRVDELPLLKSLHCCVLIILKDPVSEFSTSPSESKDLSDNECDVPAYDDFTTFSNLLFDNDDDFSSSNNESFSNEGISKEIYSNPIFDEEIICIKIDPHHFNAESDLIESLLNQDSSIISSSKIDSLLDELAGELILLKSIPLGIDKADCDPVKEICLIEKLLYDNSSPRPREEFISKNYDDAIKYFSPSPIPVDDSDSLRDEIDLSLTPNDSMPPGIEDDDYDSEGDILILKELLGNDSLSLLKNESFHFDIPSSPRPPTKPPNDDEIEPNLEILTVKVVGDISEHYVPMPRLFPTQPTHDSNQEKSPYLLSYRGLKAFQLPSESPMMIYGENIPVLDGPFLHFYPP
nr:ribonuclease H-like domain-containing protein [Tanacetum cinerariifolium]